MKKHLSVLLLSTYCSFGLCDDYASLKDGHPRPSYAHYSEREINQLAQAVRELQPQIHRGGWEWDRLLSRYIDNGRQDQNELKILHAYFMSILDRQRESLAKPDDQPLTLFSNHKSWGSGGRLRIYQELARQGWLAPKEIAEFKQLIKKSFELNFKDYSMLERGVNNRPYGINGGPALAVKFFPDMPIAQRHHRWLEALWRELTDYGDTTETNYFPYGPLFLQGFLDMAEGLGKFETERDLLYAISRRYLDYVHGGGVRGNPNSGSKVIFDPEKQFKDPWNAEYYGGAERVNDGHVWYRLAKHFEDPEFLWASEQAILGGRPPQGISTPTEYKRAYQERYRWFEKRGIQARVPYGKSKIGYYSPLKYKVPERLYLNSSRQSGKPFASYYIYDRNNNYMHYCDGADGRLYEYCVDGAKFLHTSGKYTSGRAGVGETAYDMLSVLPPGMDFPLNKEGKMSKPSSEHWQMATMAFERILNCRTAPDSPHWYFDHAIQKFRRRDDPNFGFAYGNMDGYWYLNNEYRLTSVEMGTFTSDASIQNLRLSGPKGEKTLAAFDSIPTQLKIIEINKAGEKELSRLEMKQLLEIIPQGRRKGKALRLNVPTGIQLKVLIVGLNEKFDAHKEYTRISFDIKGEGGNIRLNDRIHPAYFNPLYNRGAILVRDSLKADNQGDDSFGEFAFRNYYSGRSRWVRQTVLTDEGFLIVKDQYTPDRDLKSYQASPCWLIKAEGPLKNEELKKGRNWVVAPARDYAWWQKRKKRVLLYMHPQTGRPIQQILHRSSQDIRTGPSQNTFQKAVLTPGKTEYWLSVLIPFNDGVDPKLVAEKVSSTLDQEGNATVTIGTQKISIFTDSNWKVVRR